MPEFAKGGYIEGSADGIAPIFDHGCDYVIPAETIRRMGLDLEALRKMREALHKDAGDA